MDTGGIGAIGRQADLEDRIVRVPGIGGGAGSHRRVLRELHNAAQASSQISSSRSDSIMPRLSTPLIFPTESVGASMPDIGAGRGKGANQSGSRIGRPAHHLHRRLPLAGIDRQHLQLVGVEMLLGSHHPRDDEGLQASLRRRPPPLQGRSRWAARQPRRASLRFPGWPSSARR